MATVYNLSTRRKSFLGSLSITTILILINVFVFFVLLVIFGNNLFVQDGFVSRNIVLSLQNVKELRLWTFITSMFMHGSLIHIFANMISLLFLGSFVERLIGKKRFFYFYMISGLFAGILFILTELLFPSGLGAVGASGAIFGVAGLMMVLTPNLPLYVMFIPIPIKAKYAVPGLLVVLWLLSITAGINIGNTAHLGGLLVGLAYGFYLRNKYKRKTRYISRIFS